MTLAALQEAETELTKRFSEWSIRVIPAVQPLPDVPFTSGAELGEPGRAAVQTAAWALKAWEIAKAEVRGRASLGGSASANRALALERANAVAALLKTAGIEATAESSYGQAGQAQQERRLGQLYFQSAEIVAQP